MSSELEQLTESILKFRDARNWKQYHNLKDIAICLNVEAGELLELFLWKSSEEVHKEKLKDELADVFYSTLLLAHESGINLNEALMEKLKKNEDKYPVEKVFGRKEKYDELK
jgi:NTP pyrophosphatase (non-canonical NTP hydrolase)